MLYNQNKCQMSPEDNDFLYLPVRFLVSRQHDFSPTMPGIASLLRSKIVLHKCAHTAPLGEGALNGSRAAGTIPFAFGLAGY